MVLHLGGGRRVEATDGDQVQAWFVNDLLAEGWRQLGCAVLVQARADCFSTNGHKPAKETKEEAQEGKAAETPRE